MARPVRFNINPIQANLKDSIQMADMPEGHQGEGFFTTKLSE
jgi:NADH-quinone oxidoreductase subunit B